MVCSFSASRTGSGSPASSSQATAAKGLGSRIRKAIGEAKTQPVWGFSHHCRSLSGNSNPYLVPTGKVTKMSAIKRSVLDRERLRASPGARVFQFRTGIRPSPTAFQNLLRFASLCGALIIIKSAGGEIIAVLRRIQQRRDRLADDQDLERLIAFDPHIARDLGITAKQRLSSLL
jgi:hypothetical protein